MLLSLLCWALTPRAAAMPPTQQATLPAIESRALQPLVDDLVPLVEEAAGARFHTIPEVVLADPDTLAEVLYTEQMHLLGELTELEGGSADASARDTATQVAHLMAGKYGFLDKKLYLSLEGIGEALAQAGAEPRLVGPLIQVVLAHELTHALQDQQVDLARVVIESATADAVMAANCTVEGHAVWVQEQVAARLGLDEASEVMSLVLGYQEGGLPVDATQFYSSYVYGLGRDFSAWHTSHGGTDHMWDVLASPPRATSMIVHPSTYMEPSSRATLGLPKALRRASRRLGRRRWAQRTQPLGDFDVRDQLVRSGAGGHLADRVDEAWHARSVGGEMLGVEVQVLRFARPALAQAYVLDMGRQAAFQAAATRHDTRVIASAGVFDAVASDVSARESIALQVGESHELGTVWLAQGGDVVQVITVNRTPTDRRIARAVRPVLKRLDQQPLPPEALLLSQRR